MFRATFNKCLTLASPAFSNELELRNARRSENPLRWFTDEEAAVVGVLAKIIVPSGDGFPGIEDIFPAGQNASDMLGTTVAENSDKREFYSRGLLAFDRWAFNDHGRGFADLTAKEQIVLFRAAQDMHDRWAPGGAPLTKVPRVFRALLTARKGCYHAAMFYPVIRNDCLEIFYTSSASWTFLRYDGPPMDQGYPSLTRPR